MSRYTISSLGCKVNQYDAQAAAALLDRLGWQLAGTGEPAELALVQTCCVTATAMRKSRQTIRRIARHNPAATLCVLGCYSTYHAGRIEAICDDLAIPADRRLILGQHDHVAAELHAFLAAGQRVGPARSETPETIKARRSQAAADPDAGSAGLDAFKDFPGHQRAFVKIQDGCDAFCSYCIVPYLRARLHSRPADEILAQCSALLDSGHAEIVLTGVFLGAYGRDSAIRRRWTNPQQSPLAELLAKVASLPKLWRVRLSSLEPADVTEPLLDALAHPAVAPHLHLPLQSGSARILRKMNRQYTPAQFDQAVARLRETLDEPTLTTDIIVGYPGESEADFAETLSRARDSGFAKIRAFPFSAIEPTLAWQHRSETPSAEVVRERLARLGDLEADLARAARESFIGQSLQAVVETAPPAGPRRAMTDRCFTATFHDPAETPAGTIVELKITGQDDTALLGQPT